MYASLKVHIFIALLFRFLQACHRAFFPMLPFFGKSRNIRYEKASKVDISVLAIMSDGCFPFIVGYITNIQKGMFIIIAVIIKSINTPDASVGVCCSHKVIALGFNTLCYDAERRGIRYIAKSTATVKINRKTS